jgi:cytochrome oxidase assembly protein ShyY1
MVIGCLWAAQWQFHRGVDRQERNNQIEARADLPAISVSDAAEDAPAYEWRKISATGTFDASRQILLRNRYFEGKYGFEVLTAFEDKSGALYWVDRCCGFTARVIGWSSLCLRAAMDHLWWISSLRTFPHSP